MNKLRPTFWLVFILASVCAKGPQIKIKEQPLSLLIPVNETSTYFSCKALCPTKFSCISYWIVNNSHYILPSSESLMEISPNIYATFNKTDRGFESYQNYSLYSLTLSMNDSEAFNNTRIKCLFIYGGDSNITNISTIAHLAVISSAPVSPNPKLESNSTHLTLLWSPPFLWPGHRIQYYNISVTNENSETISHYIVKGNYNSSLVSFTKEINDVCKADTTVFELSILPYNTSISLPSFGIMETIQTELLLPEVIVNTSVLFQADGQTPVLVVYIQIPQSLCHCVHLNYTLTIESTQGVLVAHSGPTRHIGPGVIKEIIANGLIENQTYLMRVTVRIGSQNTTEYNHTFNTSHSRQQSDTLFFYQVTMYISVGMAIVFFSVMVLLITCSCLCYRKRKRVCRHGSVMAMASSERLLYSRSTEKRVKDMKRRLCKSMIHNPIYDGNGQGPVYESVHPVQDNTKFQVSGIKITEITNENLPSDCGTTTEQFKIGADSSGYLTLHNKAKLSELDESEATSTPAVPNKNAMALKKSGKERNKLHLTLTLGTNNDTTAADSETGRESTVCPFPPEAFSSQVKSRTVYMNQANIGSLYSSLQPAAASAYDRISYGNSEYYDV